MVFDRLTVLCYNPEKKEYSCKCECGKIISSGSSKLKRGLIKSCGCLRAIRTSERTLKPNHEGILNSIYGNYARGARARNIEFSISKEEFKPLLLADCNYCGTSPNIKWSKAYRYKIADVSDFRYNGIDRVDNSKGYISGNCVPCCTICNKSKLDMSVEEWMTWLKRIAKYQKIGD
jgi:hypothetical protein